MSESSVLRELPLPDSDSELVARVKQESDSSSKKPNDSSSSSTSRAPCCLCPHALARKSHIYGRTIRRKKNNDTSHDFYENTWLSWKTSLAPHCVTQIVSNRDGTILAAATDGGTVSLLRGSDGKVLATRQVADTSPLLSFVPRLKDQDGDTLLIQTQVSDEDQDQVMKCIVVSNIQGSKLNGIPQSAAEATRQMKIRAIPKSAQGWEDIARATAVFKSESILLLATVTLQGQFRLFDWNLDQGTLIMTTDSIPLQLSDDNKKEWAVDYRLGFMTQPVNRQIYIVFVAYTPGSAALAWLNPYTNQCVCHIPLNVRSAQVGVFVPLPSYESTLAVGVAIKAGASTTRLHVYQIVVEETMGLNVLTKPHLVFRVPIDCPLHEVSLATTSDEDVYTFAHQFWRNGEPVVAEVRPAESSSLAAIGKIRYCVKLGQFDKADKILASLDEESLDPLADFHPSEVASARLQTMIADERPKQADIHNSLQRLAAGAKKLNSTAIETFARACEMIPDQVLNKSEEFQIAVIDQVLPFVDDVIDSALSLESTVIKDVELKLRDRRRALRFVGTVPDKQTKVRLVGARSTEDLLAKLLANQCYWLVEKLWGLEGGQALSVDQLLAQIVSLPANVDPAGYLPLLKSLLFPNLTVHNELLPILRAWSCETADKMDENEIGLAAAIALLETVQDGVCGLHHKLHSSFATDSPFVEGLQLRKPKRPAFGKSRSNILKPARFESSVKLSSVHSKTPEPIIRAPPTILQLGGLKAGAKRKIVRKIGKWSTTLDIDEECVEQKLAASWCLQRARKLGLPKESLYLRDFNSTEGLQGCTQSLLLSLSQKTSEHKERLHFLRGPFKEFCDEFGCIFDDELLRYICFLCLGTAISPKKIEEAASVSLCCCSDENKSAGTLAVVRAGLLCAYTEDWLLEQAQNAIEWASSNATLHSEMAEAARLLLIDSIICKYCGSGARELFRVDNLKHANNLMDFVIRRVTKLEQIHDVLGLCNAFHHLPRRDALVSVLRQGILKGETQLCVDILASLFNRDRNSDEQVLAGSVLIRAISFIAELLSDTCSMSDECVNLSMGSKASVTRATEIGCELLSTALQHGIKLSFDFDSQVDCFLMVESLAEMDDKLKRIHELQTRHDIFLSLSDLCSPKKQVIAALTALQRAVDAYLGEDYKGFRTKIKRAERACMLLTGGKAKQKEDVWVVASACVADSLISQVDPYSFCRYLNDAGVLNGEQNGVACRALVRLALSLCKTQRTDDSAQAILNEAFQMSLACSLVRDHAIHICVSTTLLAVLDADSVLDCCHSILAMMDNGLGDKTIRFREAIVALLSRNSRTQQAENGDEWDQLKIHQPSLHSTWYHGDGLLLPPEQTNSLLKRFCGSTLLQSNFSSQAASGIQRLLSEKGASFARLRIVNTSLSKIIGSLPSTMTDIMCDEVTMDFEKSMESLAERSLGGSGLGMTSGVIDSELAVAFLLCLPVKPAHTMYTSTIPLAMKTQQYRRVNTLANIGKSILSGSGWAEWTGGSRSKLLELCNNLALKSSWWIRFSDLDVRFDHLSFEDPSKVSAGSDAYVSSLILPSIVTLSKRFDSTHVLKILTAFARDFNFDQGKVLESHVEYLVRPFSLLAGETESAVVSNDYMLDVAVCSRMAKNSLRRMTTFDRTRVLRRCVKAYELQPVPLTDYERYACVLSLYREALVNVLQKERASVDSTPFEVELELVDCRRDALEILSSYFVGHRSSLRPDFLGFFEPLQRVFGESKSLNNSHVTVLGCPDGGKDPLSPLRSIMLSSNNVSASSALSPLFAALGLPQGYIRARFLLARFELSTENGTSLPSFENEVFPVLQKLRLPRDKTVLAEFVAGRYTSQDEDRLKCYDVALKAAMQNSSEIELRRRNTPGLAEIEAESLETVRRLTVEKSALSDKLRVVAILKSGVSNKGGCLDRLIRNLVSTLDGNDDKTPERLIDFLFLKASALAAEWTVDASMSTKHMRDLAELVNRICTVLSEQHSHINPQRQARILASRWLFRGNTDSEAPADDPKPAFTTSSLDQLSSIQDEEDDTLDFVLDLDELRQSDNTSQDTASSKSSAGRKQTSDEEQTALRACSSREESEKDNRLAALRVAFVLSCSVDKSRGYGENLSPRQENPTDSSVTKKRLGLLSKFGSTTDGSTATDLVRVLGEQLLKVVFAKKAFRVDAFNDSMHSMSTDVDGYDNKTITYAMRHRALRAAAILCPQEILEDICHNESYLLLELEEKATTLRECSFGAFVAKEIEEMGLQLPHSDLPQLSSMNFPAYARTLWRHNRDTNHCASRGRLLILLTEMTLRDEKLDFEFLGFLLDEMCRIVLPRTQLLTLERIVMSRHIDTCKDSQQCGPILWKTLELTANAVLAELFSLSAPDSVVEEFPAPALDTVSRLAILMTAMCGIEQRPKLDLFVSVATKLSGQACCNKLKESLAIAIQNIEQHQKRLELTLGSTD